MRWQVPQALPPLAAGGWHSDGAVYVEPLRALFLFQERFPIASQAIAFWGRGAYGRVRAVQWARATQNVAPCAP